MTTGRQRQKRQRHGSVGDGDHGGGGKIDGSGTVVAADAARVGGGNSSGNVDRGTGEHRQRRQQRERGQQREPGQQRELAS